MFLNMFLNMFMSWNCQIFITLWYFLSLKYCEKIERIHSCISSHSCGLAETVEIKAQPAHKGRGISTEQLNVRVIIFFDIHWFLFHFAQNIFQVFQVLILYVEIFSIFYFEIFFFNFNKLLQLIIGCYF